MKAGRCIEVLNPYDWMPPYGENGVSLVNQGLDLVISIGFDGPEGLPNHKELLFTHAQFFCKSSFPGPRMLVLDPARTIDPELLGALVEYPESEAAVVWSDHFGGLWKMKHYRIAFLSENLMVEVIANNVILRSAAESSNL